MLVFTKNLSEVASGVPEILRGNKNTKNTKREQIRV